MNTSFLVIMLLLAAAALDAASLTANDASSIPATPASGTRGYFSATIGRGPSSLKMRKRMNTHEGKNFRHPPCRTSQYCRMNRLICGRICSKPRSRHYENRSNPGKCIITCKKCVPNC